MKQSDKVVCVFDDFGDADIDSSKASPDPVLGHVYVVQSVRDHPDGPDLFLVGMCAGHWVVNGQEVGYAGECFRTLEEVKAENKAKQAKADSSK